MRRAETIVAVLKDLRNRPFLRTLHAIALILLAGLGTARAQDTSPDTLGWQPPPNLAELQALFHKPDNIPFPADHPYSAVTALLGRTLFFDARLSGSGSLSCASCHNPSFGWEDGLSVGHGDGLRNLDRHSPTLLNEAWGTSFFWDGRAPSLEAQALGPISAEREMHADLAALPDRLKAIAGYQPLFQRAFPGQAISLATITTAIATFERTIASANAPFDAWIAGDTSAISDSAKRGFVLFTGKGHCASCHTGWRFTDNHFHDIGLPTADIGRAEIAPGEPAADHAFKTPTLRDVNRRAPYMHDGSLHSLTAVMAFYSSGGVKRPSRDPQLGSLALSAQDFHDLTAFLATLSEAPQSFPLPRLPQ